MTTIRFRGAELRQLAPLRARLAEVFGVDDAALLPVRGPAHAADLVASLDGATLVDERRIDWDDKPSRAAAAILGGDEIVYREIGSAYGAATPLCGALIGAPAMIEQLSQSIGGDYLHPLICAEALKALAPARLALKASRVAGMRLERARVADRLRKTAGVTSVVEGGGDDLTVAASDASAVLKRGGPLGAALLAIEDGVILVRIGDAAANDRALAAFGAVIGRTPRVGEAIRETKETKIAVHVDLDRAGATSISTGVGYFDHMLEQIAAHGGVSLTLACEGDIHVDLHHTIEDCALALGAALSQALGERRGIARYGFVLPMDEAEAKVSIDLGGRPYAMFEGAFAAPFLGEYPTEMTAHVFRSLAQTLGAAIHVSVRGENDHHKTEACFKAFARALRAAIAVESDAVPSTKGVL